MLKPRKSREDAAVCHMINSGCVPGGKIVHLAVSDDSWERVQYSVGMVL